MEILKTYNIEESDYKDAKELYKIHRSIGKDPKCVNDAIRKQIKKDAKRYRELKAERIFIEDSTNNINKN